MIGLQAYVDARAVRRVQRGQREAFEPLARRYYPIVYGLAYAQTGNWSDAEDVAQESLLRAYRNLNSLNEPARFGPWLMRIVRNSAVDVHAKRRREQEAVAQIDAPAILIPDMESRELSEAVRRKVMELEDGPREILLLRYFSGKSLRELAATLQISTNAANKRLKRAREALGQSLLGEIDAAADRGAMEKRSARAIALIGASETGWGSVRRAAAAWQHPVAMYGAPIVVVAAAIVGVSRYTSVENQETPALVVEAESKQPASPPTMTAAEWGAALRRDGLVRASLARTVTDVAPQTQSSGRISGRLVNSQGVGQGGWTIMIRDRSRLETNFAPRSFEAATDPAGNFEVNNLGAGIYFFYLKTRRAGIAEYWFGEVAELREGEHRENVRLVFDAEYRLSGRITNSSGGPVAGARVQALIYELDPGAVDALGRPIQDRPYVAGIHHGESGADGRYEVFTPPRANNVSLYVSAEGYLTGAFTKGSAHGEMDVVLHRPAELHGHVIDARTGSAIQAFKLAHENVDGISDDVNARAAQRLSFEDATFSAAGEFVLDLSTGIPIDVALDPPAKPTGFSDYPRHFMLYAGADGYAATAIELPELSPEELLEGFVVPLAPMAEIEGFVRDRNGKPVKDALIRSGLSLRSTILTKSDAEGRFFLAQTDPPLTTLTAFDISYAQGWAEIVNGKAEFVLDEGGGLKFEVLVDGKPVTSPDSLSLETIFPGGEVRHYTNAFHDKRFLELSRASTDIVSIAATWAVNGSLGVPDRPAAHLQTYRLERPIEIEAGGMTNARFDFTSSYSGHLEGTVTADGVAVTRGDVAIVTQLADGDVLTTSSRIRGDGTFVLENVPTGAYEGRVTAEGLPAHEFSGVIEGDGVTREDVVVAP